MSRDLDIKIATLLGHYRLCNNITRAYYNEDLNSQGGSMAMGIFKEPIKESLQFSSVESSWETPERRWWQSEINPLMWYTSAVPLYSTSIVEAMKLVQYMRKDGCFISLTTLYATDISYRVIVDDLATKYITEGTLEEAICEAFVKYMEAKNGMQ